MTTQAGPAARAADTPGAARTRTPDSPRRPGLTDVIDALAPHRVPAPPPPQHLEITLRSTPPGALAAVDGTPVGPTPTFWRGVMTGDPHTFTFTLAGHTTARYRFVPTTSGIIHATLEPMDGPRLDAGTAATN